MTAQPSINEDIRNWKTMRGTLYMTQFVTLFFSELGMRKIKVIPRTIHINLNPTPFKCRLTSNST